MPAPALEPSPACQAAIANRLNWASPPRGSIVTDYQGCPFDVIFMFEVCLDVGALLGLFDPGTAARGARQYVHARTWAVPQPTGTAPSSNSAVVCRRSAVERQILPVFLTSDRDEARIPPARSASAPARRCWIMSPWVGCGNTGGRTDAERHESGGAVKQPRHAEKGEESGGSRGQPRAARASLPATISLVNRRLALVPIGLKPPDAVRLEFGQSYGQALGTCVREG